MKCVEDYGWTSDGAPLLISASCSFVFFYDEVNNLEAVTNVCKYWLWIILVG